jgi:hypothetical protein
MSLLVLFHSVFWLGVLHVSITLWTVAPCLIAVSAGAAWLVHRPAIPAQTAIPAKPIPPKSRRTARERTPLGTTLDRILILTSGCVGVVLLARSAITPLIGFDTRFRWDFLAERMLALSRFDFYPPLTPADFRTYFFVDGIPPMVSFTHWWLYASAGRWMPSLMSIFVAAQFACTLAFTYGAAASIFSRRAGVLAAAMLAASSLYFTSVVLGQETGLTALSLAATVYFLVAAKSPDDVRAMVSAGLAAALCALSREYGWMALIAGIIVLLWRRQPWKQTFVFAAVATAGAAPWYVRNWILAGNPFYSLRFGPFAVNPIHDGILRRYQAALGVGRWPLSNWETLLWVLLISATFQMAAGIPGGFRHFRRHGYLIAVALLFSAAWAQSVGYTSAGVAISTRVLTPVLVVLSIAGAGLLEPLTRRAPWYVAIVAAVVLCQCLAAAHGVIYPSSPYALRLSQWPHNAFQPVPDPPEFQIIDGLAMALPAGSRVLSDNAFLHAALIDQGIEVVPVWSPEVRFLFSSPPEEATRRLRALGINTVVYYPKSLNSDYLTAASPFYATLPQRWRVLTELPGLLSIWVAR